MKNFQTVLLMTLLLLESSVSLGQNSTDSIKAGFEIIYSRQLGNCVTCHMMDRGVKSLSNQQEKQGNFGPNLNGVGKKYSRNELIQWVTDARQIRPETLMPPYGSLEGITIPNQIKTMLSPEQIQLVVDALVTLN